MIESKDGRPPQAEQRENQYLTSFGVDPGDPARVGRANINRR